MADQKLYDLLYTYHTQLQGVANGLASQLDDIIGSTDAKVLDTILRKIGKTEPDIKREMDRLSELMKALKDIRAESFETAKRTTLDASSHLVDISCDRERAMSEFYAKSGKFNRELTKKQQQKILDYQPIDGQSISQWFSSFQAADLQRLTQAVQSAAMDRLSLADVAKKIRGTKENGYTDGILNTSRSSAQTIARTIVNGVSNHARLETMLANADVIDGVKFLATLDGKTCPFCAVYDGKIWEENEYDQIRRPPLHRNCRCTLIPYIKAGGELNNRPAANADFDKLAEDSYNENAKQNGWKRRWSDLSQATRLKYYYQAQKDLENAGTPAYRRVSNDTTFADYFQNQSPEFKCSWLGEKRYRLFLNNQLTLDSLVSPDTGYIYPIEVLKAKYDPQPDDDDLIHYDTKKLVLPNQNQKAMGDDFDYQVSAGRIRRDIVQKAKEEFAGNDELIDAIQDVFNFQYNDDFWIHYRDKSPLDIAKMIIDESDASLLPKLGGSDRVVVRQYSGVAMTADEILQKAGKRIDELNAEIHKVESDTSIPLLAKDAKLQELKKRRDQVVIDAWLPMDTADSRNRKTLGSVQISDKRYVECSNGTYVDITKVKSKPISEKVKSRQTDQLFRHNNQGAEEGLQFFGRICDNMGVPLPSDLNVSVHGQINRGFHVSNSKNPTGKHLIALSSDIDYSIGSTAAHEFCHYLEAVNPDIGRKLEAFYERITTDGNGHRNPAISIKKKRDEKYRESTIPMPEGPTGNTGKYALREYGDGKRHELLSILVQEMFRDPYGIISVYPEFFNGVMQCLK